MKYHVFYNPKSASGTGASVIEKLKTKLAGDDLTFYNVLEKTYPEYLKDIPQNETLLICGGDGTLNCFVNQIEVPFLPNPVCYYASGSGNDFMHDIGEKEDEIVDIKKYLVSLPVTFVKGKAYKFLNNVGFGIDGYCCEVGDKLHEESDKPVNYAGIAIKGLLFHYKPCDAEVIVDGVSHHFKKAWLAPTMNGRFYGGGMMAAPDQDRLNEENTLSVMVMYGKGKIKTLIAFPSIFKGEHVKKTKMVSVLTGKEITVKFASPRAVQVDGETVVGVTEYTATTQAKSLKEAGHEAEERLKAMANDNQENA